MTTAALMSRLRFLSLIVVLIAVIGNVSARNRHVGAKSTDTSAVSRFVFERTITADNTTGHVDRGTVRVHAATVGRIVARDHAAGNVESRFSIYLDSATLDH